MLQKYSEGRVFSRTVGPRLKAAAVVGQRYAPWLAAEPVAASNRGRALRVFLHCGEVRERSRGGDGQGLQHNRSGFLKLGSSEERCRFVVVDDGVFLAVRHTCAQKAQVAAVEHHRRALLLAIAVPFPRENGAAADLVTCFRCAAAVAEGAVLGVAHNALTEGGANTGASERTPRACNTESRGMRVS
jgi:hypothetical protein